MMRRRRAIRRFLTSSAPHAHPCLSYDDGHAAREWQEPVRRMTRLIRVRRRGRRPVVVLVLAFGSLTLTQCSTGSGGPSAPIAQSTHRAAISKITLAADVKLVRQAEASARALAM